jgi:hypothetical protein
MIATLAVTGTIGVEAAGAVESAGVGADGADGAWANALLVSAIEPTPVADASRQTSVNERFIGIRNSF